MGFFLILLFWPLILVWWALRLVITVTVWLAKGLLFVALGLVVSSKLK